MSSGLPSSGGPLNEESHSPGAVTESVEHMPRVLEVGSLVPSRVKAMTYIFITLTRVVSYPAWRLTLIG